MLLRKRTLMVIAILAILMLATTAPSGQEPTASPRKDLYGDSLPEGAIARFGSVRFRHAGLSDYVLLPDDRTVLTSGRDRVLRFWDLTTGRQKRTVPLQGKAGPGSAITLSPDGKTLVANVADLKQLVFWDVDSGKEVKTLPTPKGGLGYLYFSPDGKTLAVGRGD